MDDRTRGRAPGPGGLRRPERQHRDDVRPHWMLPLGLTQFRFLYSTNWPLLIAMTVIATIPIVLLYIFFQRYFVGGGVSAAVKG